MDDRWKKLGAITVGLAVGAAFLVLAFRGTSAAAVWSALRNGHWSLFGPVVLAGTAAFIYAKTARWRLLLGSPAGLTVGWLAKPVLAGLALNALVPHSGEFVRAISLQRTRGNAASAVLSSIVAERVFDLFGVLIVGAVALGFVPTTVAMAVALRLLAVTAGILATGVVAALVLPGWVESVARFVARVLPGRAQAWILRQVREALSGLEPVRSLGTATIVMLWSLIQWIAVSVCVYGCARVIGFDPGFAAPGLVVVGIVVAFLLPNAPGYAGSVQIAFLYALRPLGVAEDAALAASIVYQLLMVLPFIVFGLLSLRVSLAKR